MKNEGLLLATACAGAFWWYKMRNPFADLERSATASANGIANKIPERYHANARGLQKLRARILEKPGAWVSSAYRSPDLNTKVHGKADSHHQFARALDFGGWTLDEILGDELLGLGITNQKQYESGRFHFSWSPEYLGML